MIKFVIAILASLIPITPVVFYFMNRRKNDPVKTTKDLVLAFKAYNVFILLMAMGVAVVWLASPTTVMVCYSRLQAIHTQGWRLLFPQDWLVSVQVLP